MEEHRHEPTVHLQVQSAPPCAADSTSYAYFPPAYAPPM